MTPRRPDSEAVGQIVERILASPPEDRTVRLAELCAGDPELRRQVAAALLDRDETVAHTPATDQVTQVTISGGVAISAQPTLEKIRGKTVGSYRILGELGRGGMGIVFRAERADGLYQQEVALKILVGMRSSTARARFDRERQALARLEHPNIARLLDGGVSEHGDPYLVMERVEGIPIDRHCSQRELGLRARLGLFLQVCEAVEAAHGRLIVHRDLKPSNILVTAEGTVKLLDFGIAKILEDGESPVLTLTDHRVMTPAYASPEQMKAEAITVASDIYQLGLLLDELLVGRPAFGPIDAGLSDLVRRICEDPPIPPSERVDPLIETHPIPARRLRGDLDAIVLTALRKEPSRRYASVERLRQDVQGHLEGLPISARPDTSLYRLGKFARRHRAAVAIAVLALVLLTILSTLHVVQLNRALEDARQQAYEAEQARAESEQVSEFLIDIFRAPTPEASRGATPDARDLLDRGASRIEHQLEGQPLARARLQAVIGRIYRVLGDYEAGDAFVAEALRTRQQLLPPDHRDVLASLDAQARGLLENGDLETAETRLREVLATAQESLEPGDRLIGKILTDLGQCLAELRRFEESLDLYRQAIAIEKTHVGADGISLASLYGQVAILQRRLADMDAEQEALDEAIRIVRLQGPDHPQLVDLLTNLGSLERRRGHSDTAREAYERALEISERLHGKDAYPSHNPLSSLGFLALKEQRLDDAEHFYLRALAATTRGPDSPINRARVQESLASVYTAKGRLEEAHEILLDVLAVQREVLGPRNDAVAWTLFELGENRRRAGTPDEAIALYGESAEAFEALFGPAHPWISWPLHQMGRLLTDLERADEAIPLLERAVALREAGLEPGRDEIDESRQALRLARVSSPP